MFIHRLILRCLSRQRWLLLDYRTNRWLDELFRTLVKYCTGGECTCWTFLHLWGCCCWIPTWRERDWNLLFHHSQKRNVFLWWIIIWKFELNFQLYKNVNDILRVIFAQFLFFVISFIKKMFQMFFIFFFQLQGIIFCDSLISELKQKGKILLI